MTVFENTKTGENLTACLLKFFLMRIIIGLLVLSIINSIVSELLKLRLSNGFLLVYLQILYTKYVLVNMVTSVVYLNLNHFALGHYVAY